MEKEVEQYKHFSPNDPNIKTKAMLQSVSLTHFLVLLVG